MAGGQVFVASQDTKLYCLERKTGIKVWEFTTKWRVQSGCAFDDDTLAGAEPSRDGVVVISSNRRFDRTFFEDAVVLRDIDHSLFSRIQHSLHREICRQIQQVAPGAGRIGRRCPLVELVKGQAALGVRVPQDRDHALPVHVGRADSPVSHRPGSPRPYSSSCL